MLSFLEKWLIPLLSQKRCKMCLGYLVILKDKEAIIDDWVHVKWTPSQFEGVALAKDGIILATKKNNNDNGLRYIKYIKTH